MECPHCGKKSNGTVKFCIYCGKSVNNLDVLQKEATVKADIRTEKQNTNSTQFQSQSGISLKKNSITGAARKKSYIPVVACTVLVISIIGILMALMRRHNTQNVASKNIEAAYGDSFDETVDYDANPETDDAVEHNDADLEMIEPNEETFSDNFEMGHSDIDIEGEVLSIRDKYDRIMDKVMGGQLNVSIITEGVTAYQSGDSVQAVFVNKGVDGYDYSRKYYFDDNHLMFAYYEGSDAHRLYFKNDKLFRWRYSPVASNPQDAENYDGDYADGYQELEDYAVRESYTFLNDMETVDEDVADYILPNSDSRYLTKSDLEGLSKEECRLARNELYARHGRKFDDEALTNYFSQFDWYHPTIDPDNFDESILNDVEIANRDLIVQFEEELDLRQYFGQKKSKDYAVFLSSSSSFCCGVK